VRYVFGEFELDPGSFELLNGGRVVPLQPKVFDLVWYLLQRRDRLVGRRELLDALWPDVHVAESALTWCTSQARRALGQGRADEAPIETQRGRGYRFVAEVREIAGGTRPPPPPRASQPSPSLAAPAVGHFVGRARSMAQLRDALQHARDGHGASVMLLGEAGIGKTRCAMELAAEARAAGVSVLLGRCQEMGGAPPLWPWIQLLRQCAREAPDPDGRQRAGELLSELVPERPDVTEGAFVGHRTDAFWLLDRAMNVILAPAEGPRLVIIEDLHWADDLSLRGLELLADAVADRSTMVLATLRNGPESDSHSKSGSLRRLGRRMKAIALGGLDRDAIEEYIASVTGRSPSAALLDAVHRRTAGNALFVVETVHQLADKADAAALERGDFETPQVVRDVVLARLEGLGPAALAALRAASALGEEFEVSVLAAMLGEPVGVVSRTLDDAVRDRMIVRAGGIGRYRFTHALMREAIQCGVPETTFRGLHRLAGEALEARAIGDERVVQLAFHFYVALPTGTHDKAIHYCVSAARATARASAYEESRTYWAHALEALDFAPAPDPQTRCKLLIGLALVEATIARTGDAHEHLQQAIRLAKHHAMAQDLVAAGRALHQLSVWVSRPVDPLAREALEAGLALLPESEAALRASALSRLVWMPPYSLSVERSRQTSERALAIAGPLGGRCLVEALWSQTASLSGPDDVEELLRVTSKMIALDESLGATWWTGEGRAIQFAAHLLRGDMQSAERTVEAFGQIARSCKLPFALWTHGRLRAQLAAARGDFENAEKNWRALAAVSEKAGSPFAAAFYMTHLFFLQRERDDHTTLESESFEIIFRWKGHDPKLQAAFALHLLEAGRRDEARERFDGLALSGFGSLNRDASYLGTLVALAGLAIGLEERLHAEDLYELLRPYPTHATPDSLAFTAGSVSHHLGQLAHFLRHSEVAAEHFEVALTHNDAMGLRPWAARTRLAYATLLAESTRTHRRALELGREAARLAADLHMVKVTERARALCAELSG
jgi:DNA-binding winged helix-turn-helix (wHTH) protein